MITNEDCVQLADDCFNARGVLKTAVQVEDEDDFDEPARIALNSLQRYAD